jgi:hypothetical protein
MMLTMLTTEFNRSITGEPAKILGRDTTGENILPVTQKWVESAEILFMDLQDIEANHFSCDGILSPEQL